MKMKLKLQFVTQSLYVKLSKNSKDYGEPDITYQLAGAAEQRQPRSKAGNRAKLFN